MTVDGPDWLRARRLCAHAFVSLLGRLWSRVDVEERYFVQEWTQRLAGTGELSRGGWYSPPPLGATFLSACPPRFTRLAFTSLRNPVHFATSNVIDWWEGALFAYCSNVYLKSGIPGDFSLTIYFGDDVRIIEHFRNCAAASRQIVDLATRAQSSRYLFVEASQLLSDFGLRNVIQSRTDAAVLDLGHSIDACGAVMLNSDGTLNESTCNLISRSRRFINARTDWNLEDVQAFTIEPQLVSSRDETLPKVSLHYTVGKSGSALIVDDATDAITQSAVAQHRWASAR